MTISLLYAAGIETLISPAEADAQLADLPSQHLPLLLLTYCPAFAMVHVVDVHTAQCDAHFAAQR